MSMMISPKFSFNPAACDPYWNYVQLLMHGDGADNGVVFTDSSAVGRTVTRVNSAVTSTTHKKFGTASLLVGPADGYLQMPPTGFEWWDNDFTIECFVRYISLSGSGYLDGGTRLPCLIGLADPSSTTNAWSFGAVDGGILKFYYFNGSKQSVASASGLISAGVWYHIAMTKSGSTVRLFLDGVQVKSATVSGGDDYGIGALVLGRINNNSANAYIDDLRITKGIARYTAAFTPPTAAFAGSQCAYTGWTPANGTVPYQWYDAENANNTRDGLNNATYLYDRSGNGRHLSSASGISTGVQLLDNGVVTGMKGISTGAGGGYLRSVGNSGMLNGTAGFCAAFSLWRQDNRTGYQGLFFAETNASNTSRAYLSIEGATDDTPRLVSRRANGDAGAVLDAPTTVLETGRAVVVGGANWSGAGRYGRVSANGNAAESSAYGTAGSAYSATNSYSDPYLFRTAGPSEHAQVAAGEIITYAQPLTVAEQQKLEGYLAWRWKMLDLLASSHPYKLVPPSV